MTEKDKTIEELQKHYNDCSESGCEICAALQIAGFVISHPLPN